MALLPDLKKGKRGAIAKAISIMENDPKEARQLVKKIYKTTGKSIVIGITGPAGAGKSSLINRLSIELKKLKLKPSSYFLVSAHREENIEPEKAFTKLVNILNTLAEDYNMPVIVSTHPRTKNQIEATNSKFHKLFDGNPRKP